MPENSSEPVDINSQVDSLLNTSLSELHDIITPDPVSFWPLADGWIVLLILFVSLLLPWLLYQYGLYQSNAYRRAALSELNEIKSIQAPRQQLEQLFSLLKRTALSVYPREQIAALTGEQWWDFLNKNSGVHFSSQTQQTCYEVLYNPAFDLNQEITNQQAEKQKNSGILTSEKDPCQQFMHEIKHWIKKHKSVNGQDKTEHA